MRVVRAHAFGNDFLLLDEGEAPTGIDRAALTRALCDRHRGLGGDGLIVYRAAAVRRRRVGESCHNGLEESPLEATMSLLNADGSYSEVSGNGVRCLAAWLAVREDAAAGALVDVETDVGIKRLELLERRGTWLRFRAAMGPPEHLTLATLDLDDQTVQAVTLRVGNPQCVVLGEVTLERLHAVAARLAVHPHFPQGTNVELAAVEAPDRVRILIWERGVGPTEASGTGACAAAVAAIAYGGAQRDVEVVSPGGTQRVEWRDDGLYLSGEAEVIATCEWRRDIGQAGSGASAGAPRA